MQPKSVMISAIALGLGITLVSQSILVQAGGIRTKETASVTRGIKVTTGSNVKLPSGNATNDPKSAKPAPAAKGSKNRGGYYSSQVQIVNQTPWKIQLFANGSYLGIVSPYGISYVPVTSGTLVLEGRADFTDGSSSYWGPRSIYMDTDDVFTWTLT